MHDTTHYRNSSNTSYDTNISKARCLKSQNNGGKTDRLRSSQINANRYSCGDFSVILNQSNKLTSLENGLRFEQGIAYNFFIHAPCHDFNTFKFIFSFKNLRL